jgi:hypothetical protein
MIRRRRWWRLRGLRRQGLRRSGGWALLENVLYSLPCGRPRFYVPVTRALFFSLLPGLCSYRLFSFVKRDCLVGLPAAAPVGSFGAF